MVDSSFLLDTRDHIGHRQMHFWGDTGEDETMSPDDLMIILRDAIAQKRFEIAMQPIMCTVSRSHHGFEVLARLNFRGRQIAPSTFIPFAQQTGMIAPIGRIILSKALEARNSILKAGCLPGKLSINFGALEVCEQGFLFNLFRALDTHQVRPEDITIEITETAMIDLSRTQISSVISTLRRHGIQVALDDFGTGFSSISHLKYLDVNIVKIDNSFIKELQINAEDRIIVRGIISLAQKLGMKVVAEGVELKAQADFLKKFGCNLLQGYFFSRPLTLDSAVAFLKLRQQKI